MPQPNTQYHNWLAYDNLTDCAQNLSRYLSLAPFATSLGSGSRGAGLVAASAAINTTETVLVQVPLVIAVPNTLNVGSVVKATLLGTCTSTNADVSTFGVRAGILGTVADQLVSSATVTSSGSGAAVAFEVDIEFTVRTLGATGTAEMGTRITNTGITGLSAVTNTVVLSAGTNLATTTATFLSVTYVAAAITTTSTFQIANLVVIP